MQAKLVAFALKFLVSYLRTHPELVKKVSDLIPGKLDDVALSVIAKLLGV